MRKNTIIRARAREAGASTAITLLVLAVLASMLAATLIMSSVTAVTTGSMRYGEERASLNAVTGLALAGVELEADVSQAFLNVVGQLNGQKDRVDMTLPQLAGVTFPEIEYTYDQLPGEGNTREDRATVRAVVTLAGPPKQVGLNGLEGEPKGAHQDIYTFRVRLTAEGQSIFGARKVARQEAHVYVAMIIKEGVVSAEPARIAANPAWPSRRRVPTEVDPWQIVPTAHAAAPLLSVANVASYSWPGSAEPPAGAWNGPPVIVSGPTPVGFDNGNKLYYWYLKGVPTGSTVTTNNAKLVANDSWRFDPTYRASDDTIEYKPAGAPPARVKGTPQYAVVIAQAPDVYAQSAQNGSSGTDFTGTQIRLPNGNVFGLSVTDRAWFPNMVDLYAPDGAYYRLVSDPESDTTFPVQRLQPPTNPCTGCWRLDTTDVTQVNRGTFEITVPGTRQNNGLWGGPLGSAGSLSLMQVNSSRERMRAVFVSIPSGVEGSSGYSENSSNGAIDTSQGSFDDPDDDDDPWDPPPPGEEPGAMAIVVMYVPMSTYFVPERVEYSGPGK